MFQMSKQLFDQCWPVIATQIVVEKSAADARDDRVPPAPLAGIATEAGYVLGVAIGFALQVDVATGVPGRRAEACGDINWPHVVPLPAMPQGLYNRLA